MNPEHIRQSSRAQSRHTSAEVEESRCFPVVRKLGYSTRPAELHACLCFLLSPVIVFKLNFNLLMCLRRKMKSNHLIIYIHTHTHGKYRYWIVHIAEKKPAAWTQKNEEKKSRLNVGRGGKCETLGAEMLLPLPLLVFTLTACVTLWMAAAGRCMEPALARDDDWYGHISPLAEDKI